MSTTSLERPTSADLAESARQTQLATRAAAMAAIAQAWPTLNFSAITETWPTWLARASALLRGFHAQSSRDGSLLYRGLRQLELGDPGNATLALPPAEEWLQKALGYAGPGTYETNIRRGATPDAAQRAALTSTLGVTSRIVLDGARSTVIASAQADPEPVRWYRVTDGDPCAFCALVASRGAVYRSPESAGDDDRWHNDCGCSVAPSFTRDHDLTGVALRASEVYAEVADIDPAERMAAFRRAWRDH